MSMFQGNSMTILYVGDTDDMDKDHRPNSLVFLKGGKVAEGDPHLTFGEMSKMSDEQIFAAAQAAPTFIDFEPGKVTMDTDTTGNAPESEMIEVLPSKVKKADLHLEEIAFTPAVTSTVFYESSYLVVSARQGTDLVKLIRTNRDAPAQFMLDQIGTPGIELDPKS